MKYLILLVFLLLGTFKYGFSQVIVLSDCGWTYIYDNAGNRVARAFIPCGSAKKDNADSTQSILPTNKEENTFKELDLILYPNPTLGKVNLQFSSEVETAQILVFDNLGRLVQKQSGSGLEVPLDLTSFVAGTYHIIIKTNAKSFTKSVLKE